MACVVWQLRRDIDDKVNTDNFYELIGKNSQDKVYSYLGHYIDFTDISKDNLKQIMDYLKRVKPRWICLSPTMAEKYAEYIMENNVSIESLKYIELQGEFVCRQQRMKIEAAFDAKTVLHYGMREAWTIAYECKFGHLHFLDKYFIGELADKSDNMGRLIISSGIQTMMPIVRYDTGDYVKVHRIECCQCGKKNIFELELLGGRKASMVKDADGLIADLVFKRIIRRSIEPYGYSSLIRGFRVIHHNKNLFEFEIVADGEMFGILAENIIKHGKIVLGDDKEIMVTKVDKIELTETGKYKLYSCKF